MAELSEKPVLALGGSGRVGRMVRAGFEVIGENRVIWQSRTPISGGICFAPLSDDGMGALVSAMKGRKVVFALAGVTPATGAPFDLNSTLAERTLLAAEQAGVPHVFFVSSAAVYGVSNVVHGEEETLTPVSDYGISKQRMEEGILQADSRVRAVILRIGNIVGADQLIGRTGGDSAGDIALDQFPDGGFPERSYMGPLTLATVLSQLFESALAGADLPDIVNISAPEPVSMADLLRVAGYAFQARPAPAGAIRRVILDTARIQALVQMHEDAAEPAHMMAEWYALQNAVEGRKNDGPEKNL